jgi:hypothetical protein
VWELAGEMKPMDKRKAALAIAKRIYRKTGVTASIFFGSTPDSKF